MYIKARFKNNRIRSGQALVFKDKTKAGMLFANFLKTSRVDQVGMLRCKKHIKSQIS